MNSKTEVKSKEEITAMTNEELEELINECYKENKRIYNITQSYEDELNSRLEHDYKRYVGKFYKRDNSYVGSYNCIFFSNYYSETEQFLIEKFSHGTISGVTTNESVYVYAKNYLEYFDDFVEIDKDEAKRLLDKLNDDIESFTNNILYRCCELEASNGLEK